MKNRSSGISSAARKGDIRIALADSLFLGQPVVGDDCGDFEIMLPVLSFAFGDFENGGEGGSAGSGGSENRMELRGFANVGEVLSIRERWI